MRNGKVRNGKEEWPMGAGKVKRLRRLSRTHGEKEARRQPHLCMRTLAGVRGGASFADPRGGHCGGHSN